jgi:GT2 family glycosyltransferase
MSKVNTFVIPIIRSDFIAPMLESLWKYTEPNFNVIVIDQTGTLDAYNSLKDKNMAHLWIHVYRNLGFSKAMNQGIVLSQTPYITLANDDLLFINKKWWPGIIDTFKQFDNIIAVNPNSPKEGAWGYGLRADNKDTWIPPKNYLRDPNDENSIIPVMPDGTAFTYEQAITEKGYNWLLDGHPGWKKDTLCDAIAMWCTTFSREGLQEIGLMEERFYPGGGEDYDMNCRAYSCGWPTRREECDPKFHKRMVGTTKSWVWHQWGKSRNMFASNPKDKLFLSRPRWNDNDELWEGQFDVWGHMDSQGKKRPLNRASPIHIDEL